MLFDCFYLLLFIDEVENKIIFGLVFSVLKIILILLSIAFITLFERKIIGYSQIRLGPNKTFFKGLLQPIYDALKLFIKEFFFPFKRLVFGFIIRPVVGFLIIRVLWGILNTYFYVSVSFSSLVLLLILIGLSVYTTLLAGWARIRKFASVGSIRSCGQSVSYEISLVFLLLAISILNKNFSIRIMAFNVFLLPVLFMIFLRCVAETNRAPFDFREGERELISGFNIEFGSTGFVLLFLTEYGIVLFFSVLICSFFFDNI